MDPNANLIEQEALLVAEREYRPLLQAVKREMRARGIRRSSFMNGGHSAESSRLNAACYRYECKLDLPRLRELRAALTDWIQSGGLEPDWSATPIASRYYGK